MLFATNLSQACIPALKTAVYIAAQNKARLILLYVAYSDVPKNMEKRLEIVIGPNKFKRIKKEHEHEVQKTLMGKMAPGKLGQRIIKQYCVDAGFDPDKFEFNWKYLVITDKDLVGTILKQAAENECSFIVMGLKRGSFKNHLVGATIKRVLEKTKIPVIVVPPNNED